MSIRSILENRMPDESRNQPKFPALFFGATRDLPFQVSLSGETLGHKMMLARTADAGAHLLEIVEAGRTSAAGALPKD